MPDPGSCPECGARLAVLTDGLPWCPRCEWNLDVWDPFVLPPRGSARLEEHAHAVAYRVDAELFSEVADGVAPVRRGLSALALASAAVLIAGPVLIAGGIALLVVAPKAWVVLVGLVLIVVGASLAPHPGRRPRRAERASAAEQPALFALIDDICARLDMPPPDHVVLGVGPSEFVRRGWRYESVLRLGPLWVRLGPQLRAALLATLLARGVSGDPGETRLTAPMLRVLRRRADWWRAQPTFTEVMFAKPVRKPLLLRLVDLVFWSVGRPYLNLYVHVARAGFADRLLATYRADQYAVEIAGTDATIELLDRLLYREPLDRLFHHIATRVPPAQWPANADGYLAIRVEEREQLRQHDARRLTLWEPVPPPGCRAIVATCWPPRPPAIVPDVAALASELSGWVTAMQTYVLNGREFVLRPRRATAPVRPGDDLS